MQTIDSRSPEYFHEAITSYQRAANDYEVAVRSLVDATYALAAAKSRVQDIEDEIMVNGGTEDHPVDGKNSEQRAAQLRVAQSHSEDWLIAAREVRIAESARGSLQADADVAANQMSAARRRADYAIAEVNRDAAIKAGHGTEKGLDHARR